MQSTWSYAEWPGSIASLICVYQVCAMSESSKTPSQAASNGARPHRRWLSFSLKTLLIVVTVLGVWLGVRVNEAQKQRRARDQLAKVGGTVLYDYQWKVDRALPLGGDWDYNAESPVPAWLNNLVGEDFFVRVKGVTFAQRLTGRPEILTAVDLACLHDLPCLESLGFTSAEVSDDALAAFRNLPQLKELALARNQSDDDLKLVARLKRLETVTLYGPGITSDGMIHLQQMPHLKTLLLAVTNVDGNGISQLQSCKSLKTLIIYAPEMKVVDAESLEKPFQQLKQLENLLLIGTPLTASGQKQLQQSLPHCKVDFTFPSAP